MKTVAKTVKKSLNEMNSQEYNNIKSFIINYIRENGNRTVEGIRREVFYYTRVPLTLDEGRISYIEYHPSNEEDVLLVIFNNDKNMFWDELSVNGQYRINEYIKNHSLYESIDPEIDEDPEIVSSIDHPDYGICTIKEVFDPDALNNEYYEVYDEDGDVICEIPREAIDMTDEDAIIDYIDDNDETEDIIEDTWDSFEQTQAYSYGDLEEIHLDCPELCPVVLRYDEDDEVYDVYDESDNYLGEVSSDIVEEYNANDNELEEYLDSEFA